MNSKRKYIFLSILTAFLCAVIFVVSAAMPIETTVRNLITTGSVSLKINERMLEKDIETEYIEPAEGMPFVPGASISRIVTMENTGSNPFYLRAKAVVTVEGEKGNLPADVISLNISDKEWLPNDDGWLYYRATVDPGEMYQVKFFDTVIFQSDIPDSYQNSKVKITIEGQAVQSKNNPLAKGENPAKAVGWPLDQ